MKFTRYRPFFTPFVWRGLLALMLLGASPDARATPIVLKTVFGFDEIFGTPFGLAPDEFPAEIEVDYFFDTDDDLMPAPETIYFQTGSPFSFEIRSGIPELDNPANYIDQSITSVVINLLNGFDDFMILLFMVDLRGGYVPVPEPAGGFCPEVEADTIISGPAGILAGRAGFYLRPDGRYDCQSYLYRLTDMQLMAVATVPEPATLALLGFGLAGLAIIRRRRRPIA